MDFNPEIQKFRNRHIFYIRSYYIKYMSISNF